MLRTVFDLFKQTFKEFNEDNAPRLAAALSYYIAFSLAPLLVITIAIVGFVLQEDSARAEVLNVVSGAMGQSAGEFVTEMVDAVNQPGAGILSTILGVGALLLGALGAFEQLKNALNTVWNVPDKLKPGGIRGLIFNKLLSFGMVLMVGFLLLVSLVLSTVLSWFETYTLTLMPGSEFLMRVLNFVLSFGVVVLLFAMIYRFLPDITLKWRDVWVGAAITALLFTIGKFLLGLYLGNSGTASAYGAAGSFVLILLWIYYSAQIVLFGAEFTQVYAHRFGSLRGTGALPTSAADSTDDKPQDDPAAEVQPGYNHTRRVY